MYSARTPTQQLCPLTQLRLRSCNIRMHYVCMFASTCRRRPLRNAAALRNNLSARSPREPETRPFPCALAVPRGQMHPPPPLRRFFATGQVRVARKVFQLFAAHVIFPSLSSQALRWRRAFQSIVSGSRVRAARIEQRRRHRHVPSPPPLHQSALPPSSLSISPLRMGKARQGKP